jgi:hypothetical protein
LPNIPDEMIFQSYKNTHSLLQNAQFLTSLQKLLALILASLKFYKSLKMHKTYTAHLVFFLVGLFSINAHAQPDEMFRGNPEHNKNYAGQDDKIFNKISWTFKTSAAVRSSCNYCK